MIRYEIAEDDMSCTECGTTIRKGREYVILASTMSVEGHPDSYEVDAEELCAKCTYSKIVNNIGELTEILRGLSNSISNRP